MSIKKWSPSQIQMAIEAVGPHRMRTKRLRKKLRSHPDRYFMWHQKRAKRTKGVMVSITRIFKFTYPTEMLEKSIFDSNPLLDRIKKYDSRDYNIGPFPLNIKQLKPS